MEAQIIHNHGFKNFDQNANMSNEKEINTILERLLGTEEVIGVMLFTAEGSILGSKMSSTIKEQPEAKLVEVLARMIESIEYFGIEPDEMAYSFDNYSIIIKSLSRGYLFILNNLSVNRSMLNIAINMTTKKLKSLPSVANLTELGKEKQDPIPFKPLTPAPSDSTSASLSKKESKQSHQDKGKAPNIVIKKLSSENLKENEAGKSSDAFIRFQEEKSETSQLVKPEKPKDGKENEEIKSKKSKKVMLKKSKKKKMTENNGFILFE